MPLNRISLYRASLLADNLGIRLCLAAVMVMPSALVFLLPVLALLGAPDDALLPGGPVRDASGLVGAAVVRPRHRLRGGVASHRLRGRAAAAPAGRRAAS